jgi:hypothetical protein
MKVIEESKKIQQATGGCIQDDWSIRIGMSTHLIEQYLEEQCLEWNVMDGIAYVATHDERFNGFKVDVRNEIYYKSDLLAYSDSKMVDKRLVQEIEYLRGLIHDDD